MKNIYKNIGKAVVLVCGFVASPMLAQASESGTFPDTHSRAMQMSNNGYIAMAENDIRIPKRRRTIRVDTPVPSQATRLNGTYILPSSVVSQSRATPPASRRIVRQSVSNQKTGMPNLFTTQGNAVTPVHIDQNAFNAR